MSIEEDFYRLDITDDEGRRRVPRPEIVQLAIAILDAFKELRPLYTPGNPRVGKRDYPHFYKAGELCDEMKMTPVAFTKMQLEGMAQTGKFYARGVSSVTHASLGVPDHHMSRVRSVRLYKSMLQLYEVHAKIYGPRDTIEDHTLQFTPLFRAVMAAKCGFQDLLDSYLHEARLELAGVPVAREVFDGMLGAIDARD